MYIYIHLFYMYVYIYMYRKHFKARAYHIGIHGDPLAPNALGPQIGWVRKALAHPFWCSFQSVAMASLAWATPTPLATTRQEEKPLTKGAVRSVLWIDGARHAC